MNLEGLESLFFYLPEADGQPRSLFRQTRFELMARTGDKKLLEFAVDLYRDREEGELLSEIIEQTPGAVRLTPFDEEDPQSFYYFNQVLKTGKKTREQMEYLAKVYWRIGWVNYIPVFLGTEDSTQWPAQPDIGQYKELAVQLEKEKTGGSFLKKLLGGKG